MENHSVRINYTLTPHDTEQPLIHDNQTIQLKENNKKSEEIIVHTNKTKGGLFNSRALIFVALWFFFSGCTLFLNKYILSYMDGNPTILGACQMLMTTICGFIQMYFPCGMYRTRSRLTKPAGFYKHMILVGCTRFATVVLGLVSLNYVAVSFTETIKSSAPIFTVLISRYLLAQTSTSTTSCVRNASNRREMLKRHSTSLSPPGLQNFIQLEQQNLFLVGKREHTGLYVNLSLIPVMGGLALCSVNEISFDVRGFIAVMATNVTECLQNVYSKMLISGNNFRYTPAELQFYTSLASIVVQVPVSILLLDLPTVEHSLSFKLFTAYLLNGVFFHFQSITAYALMDYVSPVTHSVANTAKRASLIWVSVLLFNNPVTGLSALGTCLVIAGVLLYSRAQKYDGLNKGKLRHS